MVVSLSRRAPMLTPNTLIFVMGTPQKVLGIVGYLHVTLFEVWC